MGEKRRDARNKAIAQNTKNSERVGNSSGPRANNPTRAKILLLLSLGSFNVCLAGQGLVLRGMERSAIFT